MRLTHLGGTLSVVGAVLSLVAILAFADDPGGEFFSAYAWWVGGLNLGIAALVVGLPIKMAPHVALFGAAVALAVLGIGALTYGLGMLPGLLCWLLAAGILLRAHPIGLFAFIADCSFAVGVATWSVLIVVGIQQL